MYCHPADERAGNAEVVEDVAVRSCVRRGVAIDLVLDPNVPIVFCETRAPAQEWAYRFVGAALAYADEH